jgi:hypothetical protein
MLPPTTMLLLVLCTQVCSSWSFSAPLPNDLRTGEQWQQCFDVELPTAQPVTVTSHLTFQFPTAATDSTAAGVGDSASNSSTVYTHKGVSSKHNSAGTAAAGAETVQQQQQQGVCIALGSKRFDVLNWGSDRLTSLPNSMAQVRSSALSTLHNASSSSSSSSSSVFSGVQQQLQQLNGTTAGSSSGSGSSSATTAAQNAGGTAVVRLKLPATVATLEQALFTLLADAGKLQVFVANTQCMLRLLLCPSYP